ncbi:MAG: S28 family serine protease [candidate division KSB1 bacterium]|nr:S28 family serine protease [candidate division KSB1 bacterium]MDZ7301205.1 S28 family serine protease [candidate division KSB1 bacterium]MDZ7310571.1 S28 family serine protease [candidate division KSB1 bacterium]
MLKRIFFSLVIFPALLFARENSLREQLKSLPDVVEVKPMTPDSLFREAYLVRVRQPLDHGTPAGKSFLQSVFVSHIDLSKPVVLETEGYAVSNGTRARELTRILKCNQIVVEHRYFGASKPDSLEWQYLTARQSADDLHHVAVLFRTIYKGKWISTGVSKGGQTTLIYRYFYPNDVDVSVPYVAPLNLAQEDPRVFSFLRSVGDEACREKIKKFQIAMLERKKEMLPLWEKHGKDANHTFSFGAALMYEYAVLEYSFSFWQSGNAPCSAIPPPGAPADSMFAHLRTVVPLYLYADTGIKYFQPFMYQAYTELGYYGYDITDFKNYLTAIKDPTNKIFVPKDARVEYHPETMQNLYVWLRDHGDNIIYIYGENDAWSASAVQLAGRTNAVKIVKKGGTHGTRIRNLPEEQRQLVYSTLENWLGIQLER